jgi:type III pantothenate kinase
MLLAIDIGNTQITLGVFKMDQDRPLKGVAASWKMSTNTQATSDEYGIKIQDFFHYAGLESAAVKGLAVASVVPPLDGAFRELGEKFFKTKPLFVGPGVKTGVNILAENPAEVGADRIVNSAGAFERVGGACIVVDFGTATTFDCVNGRGDYIGGVIAPGPVMAAEALYRKTAKLPLLGVFNPPKNAIGRNTIECMKSGLFYGYLGLTQEILRRLKKEMGGRVTILATGGLATAWAPSVKLIRKVYPDLTLEGLRLIWERNNGG